VLRRAIGVVLQPRWRISSAVYARRTSGGRSTMRSRCRLDERAVSGGSPRRDGSCVPGSTAGEASSSTTRRAPGTWRDVGLRQQACRDNARAAGAIPSGHDAADFARHDYGERRRTPCRSSRSRTRGTTDSSGRRPSSAIAPARQNQFQQLVWPRSSRFLGGGRPTHVAQSPAAALRVSACPIRRPGTSASLCDRNEWLSSTTR